MEIARVGRSSQERWGDLARGVGSYSSLRILQGAVPPLLEYEQSSYVDTRLANMQDHYNHGSNPYINWRRRLDLIIWFSKESYIIA
jgi:hypothetical protein